MWPSTSPADNDRQSQHGMTEPNGCTDSAIAHLFGNNMPTVFYCGDDRDAKSKAAELIRDVGLQPVDAGVLENARYIEPLAMLMMELGQSQLMSSDKALRLMNPAGATGLVKSADVLARSFVGTSLARPAPQRVNPCWQKILSRTFLTLVTRSVEERNLKIG
jgi:hypothetical protein